MSGQSLAAAPMAAAAQKTSGRFAVADDGAAILEFTIIAPMLIIMSIYIMDFGLYFFNRLEMQNAAQAGAQWAIASGLYNTSDIQVAAQNATNIPASQMQVTTNEFCGCPSSTGVALYNSTNPSGICPGGATCVIGANTEVAGNYVTVTATTVSPYTPFIPYGLFSSAPNTAFTSTVRIQ